MYLSATISILALISLLPWLGAAFVSIFLFDAPDSVSKPFILLAFLSIWWHPAAVIIGSIIIFRNKARKAKRYVIGIGVTLAPTVLASIAFTFLWAR